MKICIHFNPKGKNDNFEGMRLRENLLGALEAKNIPYTKSVIDTYDVIHFLSLDDELRINDATEARIPTVFSALYCEADKCARTLNDNNEKLLPKGLKLLNKVDTVLVSDKYSKNILKANGVTSNIEIITPGVDTSRFKFTSKLEEDIFYNYYQLEKNQKFIVVVGTYEGKNTRKKLIEIANRVPNHLIYYFGKANINRVSRLDYHSPDNLKFSSLTNDEIYCSMMAKATIYLSIDNDYHSPLTLLDAAASKTQIIALEPLKGNKELLTSLKAYVAKDVDEVSNLINLYMEGKLTSHVNEAYRFAKNNSLNKLGDKLMHVYTKLIDGRKNHD